MESGRVVLCFSRSGDAPYLRIDPPYSHILLTDDRVHVHVGSFRSSMVCYLADNIWFRRETSRWVVVVVSSSEFGRTIIPDSRGGSDHGRLHAFICLLIRVYMYMYIVYVFTCTYVHFAGRSNCSHLSHRFNFSNACDAALKDGVG